MRDEGGICKLMKIKGRQKRQMVTQRSGGRGDVAEVPHTPVFCKKSPQAIENKRRESRKERKERKRVRKSVRTRDLLEGQGTPREKSGGNDREARVGQKE